MRWTSKVFNPRVVVFLRVLAQRKTTSRGLTARCSLHMNVITVLLYQNYPKMLKTWMVFLLRSNKIISELKKNICGTRLKKQIFNTLPFVRVVPGNNLLFPSTLYMFVCAFHWVVSLVSKFSEKTAELSYYFYSKAKCVWNLFF